MSTGSSADHGQPTIEITLTQNEDGWWTARDETRGLTTQAKTREKSLLNLNAVISAVEDDDGEPPTDEELRDAGIDPETNANAGTGDRPDILD
jgi:predicted RNase H-like HicB family nuclease